MPSVSGTVTVGGVEFGYNEESFGTQRGIKIYAKGSPKGAQIYKFDPNPHDLREYNKNQRNFYNEAAEQIGTIYNASGAKFPRYGAKSIKIFTETYKLVSR